ncbi:MAG: glutathione synthase [Alphaproteobacteria bacterium]|nr:glutathione synthase [Alphaproteobacteria bacterium]
MGLRVAVQMDALSRIKPATDTTLAMLRAARARGHSIFYYRPEELTWCSERRCVLARGRDMEVHESNEKFYTLGACRPVNLHDFDVILMRQDPPFDLAYITATHLLERVTGDVLVVNDPASVRNAPEKILVTHFSQFMPPTLITRDIEAVKEFHAKHGSIVIKPLFMHSGHMVFHLRTGDDNRGNLLAMFSKTDRAPWMAQQYLPAIAQGDKRIILIEGEIAGALNRIPGPEEVRASPYAGGHLAATQITPREREIVAALGPVLRERGLVFVGIDVIGDYLTEINVTSPSGIMQVAEVESAAAGQAISMKFWDAVEARRAAMGR